MINKISNLPCSLSTRKFKIKRVMLLLRNQITLEESFLPKDLYFLLLSFCYPFTIRLLSFFDPILLAQSLINNKKIKMKKSLKDQ